MSAANKTIFVVTQSVDANVVGGAVTVAVNLCNRLQREGYDVYCVFHSKIGGYPRNLSENVKFVNWTRRYGNKTFSEAINILAAEAKPDLFVFFYTSIYAKANLSPEFDNVPRILMFHSRPDFYFSNKQEVDFLQKIYTKTSVAQILFDSYKNLLPDFVKNGYVITIPNGVSVENTFTVSPKEHKKIVYLSRVDCWKGLEFLINSFNKTAKKYPDWTLDIYGQSEPAKYVNKLIALTKELGVEKQICFKGVTKEVQKTLSEYDFCVFPSYFEGFPLGLLEAMQVGLPAIGLKECSGVNELIVDGKNGFLTEENYDDFAAKTEKLIVDAQLRKQFGENAKKTAAEYDIKVVEQKWLNVIKLLVENQYEKLAQTPDATPKKIFPLEKIYAMVTEKKQSHKFYQNIFSLKNAPNKKHKILTIFGIKIKFKRKKTNNI